MLTLILPDNPPQFIETGPGEFLFIERGRSGQQFVEQYSEVSGPVINLFGAHVGRRAKEAVLARFGTAVIDVRVARCHAELTARLMAAGQTIGTHDSWIAATGLALGHPLVTGNVDEFKRIQGLSVVGVLGTNEDRASTPN